MAEDSHIGMGIGWNDLDSLPGPPGRFPGRPQSVARGERRARRDRSRCLDNPGMTARAS
jgi:hypothetical protein